MKWLCWISGNFSRHSQELIWLNSTSFLYGNPSLSSNQTLCVCWLLYHEENKDTSPLGASVRGPHVVMNSGSASWEENVITSDFPVGWRKHLRRGNSVLFLFRFNLSSASSTRISCLLDFLHSEWIQHLFSSLWSAKLPVTHAWKYRARAMNSGLSFPQEESHFWSAILMRGLESIRVLSLFSLVWIPLLWLHNFLSL